MPSCLQTLYCNLTHKSEKFGQGHVSVKDDMCLSSHASCRNSCLSKSSLVISFLEAAPGSDEHQSEIFQCGFEHLQ
jgi:hypothetical protein